MCELYDTAILGAGPAGCCAAIYAKRAGLSVLWLEKSFVQGGQIASTYEVDNYPGMPGIGGMELGEAFVNHAGKLGLSPIRENVRSISDEGAKKIIRTKKHEYCAKSVILACGASHRKLDIPGEEEFTGMGVSYCATCDGAFFKDRTAAVIGGGDVAVEDAIFLSRICSKVYLIHRRDQLRAQKLLQEQLFSCKNVEILWNHIPIRINGTEQVESICLSDVRSQKQRTLDVDGVFIAVGITPNTELVRELLKLDEGGYIAAGEDTAASRPGFFAAGDIRSKQLRQVVTAIADGANAVASAQKYLLATNQP